MRRVLTCCVLLLPTLGGAQSIGIGGPDMAAELLFVPSLVGAITFDVGVEGRLDRIVEPTLVPAAETYLRLGAGYLHYFDAHGRVALGGYLSGGAALTRSREDWPELTRFDVGMTGRGRFMSGDFKHLTLAFYAELGVVNAYQSAQAPALAPDAPEGLGSHWAVGIEAGPGMLFHLSPYVFGEVVTRIGLEWMFFDEQRYATLTASIRLNFDYALRGDDD